MSANGAFPRPYLPLAQELSVTLRRANKLALCVCLNSLNASQEVVKNAYAMCKQLQASFHEDRWIPTYFPEGPLSGTLPLQCKRNYQEEIVCLPEAFVHKYVLTTSECSCLMFVGKHSILCHIKELSG